MTLYLLIIGLILFLGSIFFTLYIRNEYKKYDQEQTLNENIQLLKRKIKGAMDYFYGKYNNDFDTTVYRTIKIKVDFLKNIIANKPKEKQLYYYNRLFEMLYETEHRLLTNFENVQYIIKPLNTIRDEIVNEQLDYLRENSNNI